LSLARTMSIRITLVRASTETSRNQKPYFLYWCFPVCVRRGCPCQSDLCGTIDVFSPNPCNAYHARIS
jgi:hypothetical protein